MIGFVIIHTFPSRSLLALVMDPKILVIALVAFLNAPQGETCSSKNEPTSTSQGKFINQQRTLKLTNYSNMQL